MRKGVSFESDVEFYLQTQNRSKQVTRILALGVQPVRIEEADHDMISGQDVNRMRMYTLMIAPSLVCHYTCNYTAIAPLHTSSV